MSFHVEQSADLSEWNRVVFEEADLSVEEVGDVEIGTFRYPLDCPGCLERNR